MILACLANNKLMHQVHQVHQVHQLVIGMVLHFFSACKQDLTTHSMHQVQMGDVRLMLPCGDSQPAAGQEEGGPTSAGGPIAAERSNSAFASGDLDLGQQAPNMLVVVLAGFQATSRTTEARVSHFASPGMTPYCRRHVLDTTIETSSPPLLLLLWLSLSSSLFAILPWLP